MVAVATAANKNSTSALTSCDLFAVSRVPAIHSVLKPRRWKGSRDRITLITMKIHQTFLTAITAAVILANTANAADALLPLSAGTVPIDASSEPARRIALKWQKQWAISLAPLVVSQSLDAASSYGMRELNPLLAS